VIDVVERRLVESLKSPVKPLGFVVEEGGTRIYANTPLAGQITVLDRRTKSVVENWKLNGTQSNYPIALDEANLRIGRQVRFTKSHARGLQHVVDEGNYRPRFSLGYLAPSRTCSPLTSPMFGSTKTANCDRRLLIAGCTRRGLRRRGSHEPETFREDEEAVP